MKKIYLLLSLSYLISLFCHSQVVIKGIALKDIASYKKGDTVKIYGYNLNSKNLKKHYIIIHGLAYEYIKTDNIKLIDTTLGFWEMVWLSNISKDYIKYGWEKEHRITLKKSADNYIEQAKLNETIYEDDFLYDYIYQLINEIHPKKLIRPKPQSIKLLIVKSQEEQKITFNNGLIVLSTELIANTKTENDLIELLVGCISKIVLEYDLAVLRIPWQTSDHKELVDAAKGLTIKYINAANYRIATTNRDYLCKISGVLSHSAWENYFLMNYDKSLKNLETLYKLKLATKKDYLLLIRLHRLYSNNKDSILESIALIEEAKKLGGTELIDLEREAGLLYLRIENKNKAKESFLNYRKGLLELEKKGFDITKELDFVNQIIYKNKL